MASNLDLSRRRVAAISFLSNISTSAESACVTEIRLDCLHNTHVLTDFQERHRRQRQGEKRTRPSPTLPRKLTFCAAGCTAQQVESHVEKALKAEEEEKGSKSAPVVSKTSNAFNFEKETLSVQQQRRLRKISGNVSSTASEASQASVKLRYVKGANRPHHRSSSSSSEERMVLVTPENKLPFAIFSVLPFHKSSTRSTQR